MPDDLYARYRQTGLLSHCTTTPAVFMWVCACRTSAFFVSQTNSNVPSEAFLLLYWVFKYVSLYFFYMSGGNSQIREILWQCNLTPSNSFSSLLVLYCVFEGMNPRITQITSQTLISIIESANQNSKNCSFFISKMCFILNTAWLSKLF